MVVFGSRMQKDRTHIGTVGQNLEGPGCQRREVGDYKGQAMLYEYSGVDGIRLGIM